MEAGNSKPIFIYLRKQSGRSNIIAALRDTPSKHVQNICLGLYIY